MHVTMGDKIRETSVIPDPMSDEELLDQLMRGEERRHFGVADRRPHLVINVPGQRIRCDDCVWQVVMRPNDGSGRELWLALQTDVVLGMFRENGTEEPVADVVLNDWGGLAAGISRRHLLLRPSARKLHAFDLGSTNGSTINGVKMHPQSAYPLKSDGVLTLGTLTISVPAVTRIALDKVPA